MDEILIENILTVLSYCVEGSQRNVIVILNGWWVRHCVEDRCLGNFIVNRTGKVEKFEMGNCHACSGASETDQSDLGTS